MAVDVSGLLVGFPRGGDQHPAAIAERGLRATIEQQEKTEGRAADQAAQTRRLDLTEREVGQREERLSMDRALMPYKIRQAETESELSRTRMKEIERKTTQKQKALELMHDFEQRRTAAEAAGKPLDPEEYLRFGAQMAFLNDNYGAMQRAYGDMKTIGENKATREEFAAFNAEMAPIFFEAAKRGHWTDEMIAKWAGLATKYPRVAGMASGQTALKAGQEAIAKTLPPQAAEAIQEYIGHKANGADPTTAWNMALMHRPDAALTFERNDKLVPEDVQIARGVKRKAAETEATEAAKEPGKQKEHERKKELEDLRATNQRKLADYKAKVKATEAKSPTARANELAGVTNLLTTEINATRTHLDNLPKDDPRRKEYETHLEALLKESADVRAAVLQRRVGAEASKELQDKRAKSDEAAAQKQAAATVEKKLRSEFDTRKKRGAAFTKQDLVEELNALIQSKDLTDESAKALGQKLIREWFPKKK